MRKYNYGDTVSLSKPFYYFIERSRNNSNSDLAILKRNKNLLIKSRLSFNLDNDIFRSSFSLSLNGYDIESLMWHKRPLMSTSLAYPGSYFSNYGKIFEFIPKDNDYALVLDAPNINLYQLIPFTQ